MKGNLDTCAVVLKITQEKVVLLEEKANKQGQLILNLNEIIENKDSIITEKDNIIVVRDEQIKVLKKEKRSKYWSGMGFGASIGIAVMAILFVL